MDRPCPPPLEGGIGTRSVQEVAGRPPRHLDPLNDGPAGYLAYMLVLVYMLVLGCTGMEPPYPPPAAPPLRILPSITILIPWDPTIILWDPTHMIWDPTLS